MTPSPDWKSVDYTNLHVHLLSEAAEALERTARRTDTPRMERPALTAIVMSAAAIEAAVSHCVAVNFPPPDLLKERNPKLWLAWRSIDSQRWPKGKLQSLAVYLSVDFDAGKEPWLSAWQLGTLRNKLVHYEARPVITSDEGAVGPSDDLRPLAERLSLIGIHRDHGGTWLDVFLNHDCAEWAVRTGDSVMRALDMAPWRKVQTLGDDVQTTTRGGSSWSVGIPREQG